MVDRLVKNKCTSVAEGIMRRGKLRKRWIGAVRTLIRVRCISVVEARGMISDQVKFNQFVCEGSVNGDFSLK